MKQQHRILIIFIFMVVITSMSSFAGESIKITETQLDTEIEILSLKSDFYRLDFKKGLIPNPFNMLAGLLFNFYRFCIRIVIIIILNAFTLNIYDIFSDEILTLLEPLKIVVFDNWIGVVFAILLLYILVEANNGKATFAIAEFIKYMCFFAFFLYFLAYPIEVVSKGKELGNAIANEIVIKTYNNGEVTNSDDGIALILNQIWISQVERPWETLNFGNQVDKYKDQFLNAPPNSKERERLTKELRKEVPVYAAVGIIPMMIPLYIASSFEVGIYGILGAIAFASGALLFALIISSVFVFLIALLPRYGMQVAINWLEKGIFILLINVVAMTALMIVLFISKMIYASVNPTTANELFILLSLKSIVLYLMFRFRRLILSIFIVAKRGTRVMNRSIARYSHPYRQLRRDNLEAERRMDSIKRNISKGQDLLFGEDDKKSSSKNEKSQSDNKENKKQDKPEPKKQHSKTEKTSESNKGQNRTEKESTEEPKKRNFSEKEELANDILKKRFEHEKEEADKDARERAFESGKKEKSQYNRFVKKTMANMQSGEEPFSRRQRMNVIKEMNEYEKRGLDARSILDDYNKQDSKEHEFDEASRSYEREAKDRSSNMEEQIYREEMKDHMDFNHNITSENTNKEIAEVYLHNQYMNHKLDAHVGARIQSSKSGKAEAPQYDPFVEKVNSRIKNHHNRFSNDEIEKTVNKIEKLRAEGVDFPTYMKNMTSHDMNDIMSENSDEKTYNVKDQVNKSNENPNNSETGHARYDARELHEAMEAIKNTIEKGTTVAANEKIDYDKIRDIIEHDIFGSESMDIESIRDSIESIQKEMDQPYDVKKADELAKRVVSSNDFRGITDYIESVKEGRHEV